MNRDMLSRRLQRQGYEVAIAIDGGRASRWRMADTPDLILMDMSLPVVDGWEATTQVEGRAGTTTFRSSR